MRAYLIGLHPGHWEIVCSGFEPPEKPKEPTNEEVIVIHLNGQATSILLSALDRNEYNRVIYEDVAKRIWDTLHLSHEGVDKVRRVKIDLLMAKLNRFVIVDGEGPQEMFDRLVTLVGQIRGYGGDELDDHKVVKIMLEAYSPRNETVVTLIRDEKKFEHFTPNDLLGRLLTFDMQREEANERRKLGELQAKLDGMKIKDVALKANKSSKQGTSNKAKGSKQASTSQPKEVKQAPPHYDTTSSSSEEEDNGANFKKIDDMALFMKKYHKGLKKRTCYNCGSTDHFYAKCPYEKKENNYKKDKHEHKKKYKQLGEAHIGHEWDSTKESSDEDVNVATVTIQKSSSTPRLFSNLSDDDDHHSSHICLMAKGEKVK
jgi:hypothetical protein